MTLIRIAVFLLGIASFLEVSQGQCIRIRSGNNQQPCGQSNPCGQTSCGPCGQTSCGPCGQTSCGPCGQTCASCGTSVEDLTTLLAIVRALEEKEPPKNSINNAEEIILQLVNALVYATTHNTGCNKGSSGNAAGGGINIGGNGGAGGAGGMVGNGGGNNGVVGGTMGATGIPNMPTIPGIEQSDDGLITLDLLQPGSQANQDYEHLLRLGIAGKKVLDLGLGHDDGLVGNLLNGIL